MNRVLERAYGALTGALPPAWAGRVDLLRPSLRHSWGGPLNGQERRRQLVVDLAAHIAFDRVVEAGTYRGTTTEFLAAAFGVPVTTIEVNPRHFAYSSRRLAALPGVQVTLADSRHALRQLAARPGAEAQTLFVYLDSHGEVELPLAEELEIVTATWPRSLVMIDDFQVPDDAGYVYLEDYGPDLPLSEDRLPASALQGWSLFYPAAPSGEETGSKRGCCVLASPALASAAAQTGLRLSRVL